MSGIEEFGLREYGVIVHSGDEQDYEVENLHHGFLVSRGVVPSDWERTSSDLSTPVFSEVSYANGLSVSMDRRFFRISHDGEFEFGKKNESVEFLIRYLGSVERHTLGSAIMRWGLIATHDNSAEWIGSRFLHTSVMEGGWDSLRPELLFHVKSQGRSMSLTFSSRRVEGETNKATGIVCGIRQEAFEDNDDLVKWLSGWREHESFMLSFLESFLGVGNV